MPPSGEQVVLMHGALSATVVAVGGGLRSLAVEGRPVLDGYALGDMCDGGRGQVLAPWPNRLAGGRYRWDGAERRLPVDDPGTGGAIHGLVRWMPWTIAAREPARVEMALGLPPRPGYPHRLRLRVAYALGDDGLSVEVTAENPGGPTLPFGVGFHPYLTVGTPLVDDAILRVPAATVLRADARGIPTGRAPVEGTEADFRESRSILGAVLDACLTDLSRDPDGRARVRVAPASGTPGVTLWVDESFPFLMVFTGDTLAPERRRRGLAVEPMTCAPDAFNSGDGLRTLGPGESFRGRWGIAVH